MSSLAVVERPDHVDADRAVNFDFYGDVTGSDPHNDVAELMTQHPPVFWTPHHGGHWVIAGHPELFSAARNTEVFSSAQMGLPPPPVETPLVPINSDPPDHMKFREPLAKAFSPRSMMALEGDIRDLAVELIEKVRPLGHCEFAHDIAEPLPVTIFMKMMGLPLDKLPLYRQWVNELLVSADPQVKGQANVKVNAAMTEIIEARMEKREDDLISRLLDTRIEGHEMTLELMQSYCRLLFVAGLDTVMNGMCYGLRHMAADPALQARLRADPSRITDAMEEMLRRYTFTLPGRIIARDHEEFGVRFRKGDRVLLMLPAGDLDPRAFKDPMAYDLDREDKAHMAFNSGPHRCVGSHLARIELRILYEEMLARLPEFRLDPANPPRIHGGNVFGFDSLDLLWDPA